MTNRQALGLLVLAAAIGLAALVFLFADNSDAQDLGKAGIAAAVVCGLAGLGSIAKNLMTEPARD